jgi:hypothetical protein
MLPEYGKQSEKAKKFQVLMSILQESFCGKSKHGLSVVAHKKMSFCTAHGLLIIFPRSFNLIKKNQNSLHNFQKFIFQTEKLRDLQSKHYIMHSNNELS